MGLDNVIEELTKLLIKQDIEDKKNGNAKIVQLSQVELYKLEIKFVKFIKSYLQSKKDGV